MSSSIQTSIPSISFQYKGKRCQFRKDTNQFLIFPKHRFTNGYEQKAYLLNQIGNIYNEQSPHSILGIGVNSRVSPVFGVDDYLWIAFEDSGITQNTIGSLKIGDFPRVSSTSVTTFQNNIGHTAWEWNLDKYSSWDMPKTGFNFNLLPLSVDLDTRVTSFNHSFTSGTISDSTTNYYGYMKEISGLSPAVGSGSITFNGVEIYIIMARDIFTTGNQNIQLRVAGVGLDNWFTSLEVDGIGRFYRDESSKLEYPSQFVVPFTDYTWSVSTQLVSSFPTSGNVLVEFY